MRSSSGDWKKSDLVAAHSTSADEVEALFELVERDLADAQIEALSTDRRFAIAYEAGLGLCKIVLAAEGYRVKAKQGHHRISFEACRELLSEPAAAHARKVSRARTIRNRIQYDAVARVEESEVSDLVQLVLQFYDSIVRWMQEKHAELLPGGPENA